MNINVNSFDEENFAKSVKFAIVILTNSLDENSANFALNAEKNVDIVANIAIDVISANSFVVILTNSFDVNFAISFANFENF